MEGSCMIDSQNRDDDSDIQGSDEDFLSLNQTKRKEQENKAVRSPPSKKSKCKGDSLQESQTKEEDYKSSNCIKRNESIDKSSKNAQAFDKFESSDDTIKEVIGQDQVEDVKAKGDPSERLANVGEEVDELQENTSLSKSKEDDNEEGSGEFSSDKKNEEMENSCVLENRDLEDSFCLGLSMEESLYEKTNDEIEEPECLDSGKQKQKKRKRNKRDKRQANADDGGSTKKLRPNYFVAVKVSNSEIHQAILKVQEGIVAIEPKLSRTLVDVATSHITLMIARLDSEEALNTALSALEECKERFMQYAVDPIELKFKGVDHFRNQVVYAKLVEDEHYQRLVTLALEVRQIFADKGVCMPNEKELNPHLTIAKMSKATHRKGKNFPRKIDPKCYKLLQDIQFGSQIVVGLQLLSMNEPKDERRYFHCAKEIAFDLKHSDNTDHSQCCFPRRPLQANTEKEKPKETADSPFITPLTAIMTCAAAVALVVMISRLRSRS